MTVAGWVAARASDVPEALLAGVREALGAEGERPAREAAEVLLAAAERRLAGLLPAQVRSRDGAVPLLTIDALVTFALEAASESPEEMESRAQQAMLHLAALEDGCA